MPVTAALKVETEDLISVTLSYSLVPPYTVPCSPPSEHCQSDLCLAGSKAWDSA